MRKSLHRIPVGMRLPIVTGALFLFIEALTFGVFVLLFSDQRYAQGVGFAMAYCFAYQLPMLILSERVKGIGLILMSLWTFLIGVLLGGAAGLIGAPIARRMFPGESAESQREIALWLIGSLFIILATVNYFNGAQHENLAGVISVLIGPRIGITLLLAPTVGRWAFRAL